MNRMITMILRVVVLELVRRGTTIAIDRFSKRDQGSYDADAQGDDQNQHIAKVQNPTNKKETRQHMRMLRKRF